MSNLKIARTILVAAAAALTLTMSACGSDTEEVTASSSQESTSSVSQNAPHRTPSLRQYNDVYYYSFVRPPSAAYPYGGYEGIVLDITIETNGSVWSSFDAIVREDDINRRLTDADRELLVLNLTNALIEQEDRSLDLVQPGDTFVMLVPLAYAVPEPQRPLENQTPSQMCPMFDPCTGDMEPTPAPLEAPSMGSSGPAPSMEQGTSRAGK